MDDALAIFEASADFSPAGVFDGFLKQFPSRWAVYLLADEYDQPVQLLCVKNLRSSLKRRLGGYEPIGPTRKINYRDIVRRIHWRRVDSEFEADWIYLEAARHIFPQTYGGMVGFRPAWFVHVDPESAFPRYTRTTDLSSRAGQLLGPVEDKHAAARLIQLVEDSFDLCRYYTILVQAPHGRACAYKEMGKCPAPCDGSIAMADYRANVARSAAAVVAPGGEIVRRHQEMRSAAESLQFERAARIKNRIDQLGQLGRGPFAHVRAIEDLRYLAVTRGPRAGSAKLLTITPGRIELVACLSDEPRAGSDLLRKLIDELSAEAGELETTGAERVGLVASHLFGRRVASASFIHVDELEDKSLLAGWKRVQKTRPEHHSDEEGVMKELQQIAPADQ